MTKKDNESKIRPDPAKYMRCPKCKSKIVYYRLRSKTHICRTCGQVFYVNHESGISKPLAHEPRHVVVR